MGTTGGGGGGGGGGGIEPEFPAITLIVELDGTEGGGFGALGWLGGWGTCCGGGWGILFENVFDCGGGFGTGVFCVESKSFEIQGGTPLKLKYQFICIWFLYLFCYKYKNNFNLKLL